MADFSNHLSTRLNKEMAVIVTGSSGLVASMFKQACLERNIPFFGIDLSGEVSPTNILDMAALEGRVAEITGQIKGLKPVLFHFAAAVLSGNDLTPEQIDFTWKLNVDGTKNVIQICRQFNIPLVHISTDFVFSGGSKDEPYLPTDKPVSDNTPYVSSKIKAEEEVLDAANEQLVSIVRLAFPYGNPSHPRASRGDLAAKMLSWMEQNQELSLYADQRICPTPLPFFAASCLQLALLLSQGSLHTGTILHLVGKPTTPYEFGKMIKSIFGKTTTLVPSSINGKGTKNLVLDTASTTQILGLAIPEHEEELRKLSQAQR